MNLKNLFAKIMQLSDLYQERDIYLAYVDRKSKLEESEEKLSLINLKIAELESMEIWIMSKSIKDILNDPIANLNYVSSIRAELLTEIDIIIKPFWQGGRFDTIKYMVDQLNTKTSILEELAEADCEYGDNCPTFGSQHGQCISCKVRKALAKWVS